MLPSYHGDKIPPEIAFLPLISPLRIAEDWQAHPEVYRVWELLMQMDSETRFMDLVMSHFLQYHADGAMLEIMTYIYENGVCTHDQIADGVGVTRSRVTQLLGELKHILLWHNVLDEQDDYTRTKRAFLAAIAAIVDLYQLAAHIQSQSGHQK